MAMKLLKYALIGLVIAAVGAVCIAADKAGTIVDAGTTIEWVCATTCAISIGVS